MIGEPELWHELCDRLAESSAAFLRTQVEAGAAAIQLFDSWAGSLSAADYERYVQPHSAQVLDAMAELGVPRIHFGVGTGELLGLMGAAGADVVGVDWRVPLDEAGRRIGPGVSRCRATSTRLCSCAAWPALSEREIATVLADGRGGAGSHLQPRPRRAAGRRPGRCCTRIVELVHPRSRLTCDLRQRRRGRAVIRPGRRGRRRDRRAGRGRRLWRPGCAVTVLECVAAARRQARRRRARGRRVDGRRVGAGPASGGAGADRRARARTTGWCIPTDAQAAAVVDGTRAAMPPAVAGRAGRPRRRWPDCSTPARAGPRRGASRALPAPGLPRTSRSGGCVDERFGRGGDRPAAGAAARRGLRRQADEICRSRPSVPSSTRATAKRRLACSRDAAALAGAPDGPPVFAGLRRWGQPADRRAGEGSGRAARCSRSGHRRTRGSRGPGPVTRWRPARPRRARRSRRTP